MSKKLLPLLLLAMFSFQLIAQGEQFEPIIEVDYKSIEKTVADASSPYFYPNIFKRYLSNDTTLSIMDYHYLYYGYTFQESYNSLLRNDNERFETIMQKDNLTADEYNELISIETEWLQRSPFDLEGIYLMIVGLDNTGQKANAEIWSIKLGGLLDAIIASGDGRSVGTAFHVAKVNDEYFLLEMFGLNSSGRQELVETCDYLHVQPNDSDVDGLYFNVERHFACMNKLFNPAGKD